MGRGEEVGLLGLEAGGKGKVGGTVSTKLGVVEMKRGREGRRKTGGREMWCH